MQYFFENGKFFCLLFVSEYFKFKIYYRYLEDRKKCDGMLIENVGY